MVKDLVVDMFPFLKKSEAIEPYLGIEADSISEHELLQTPEEQLRLNQISSCIYVWNLLFRM